MINLLKKYLYISLGIHVFIIIVTLIISGGSGIKHPFIVFGAHSKKDYHTLYKAKKSVIPFIGHGTQASHKASQGTAGKSGSGKKKTGKSSDLNKNKSLKKFVKKSKITEKSKSSKLAEKKAGKKSPKNSKAEGKSKKNSAKSVASKKAVVSKKAGKKRQPVAEPAEFKDKKSKDKKTKDKKSKKQQQKELEEEKKIEEELKKIEIEEQKEIEKEIAREKEKLEAEKQKELEREIEREIKEQEAKEEREALELKAAQKEPEVLSDKDDDQEEDSDDDDDDDVDELGGDFQEGFVFTLGDLAESQAKYSRYIQSEIARLWHPPLGVAKGTLCRVKFIINEDGEVEDFQTIQKSNVIIYDLSILRVAHLFKFDKCLWGKSFVIDFRQ